MKKLENIRKLSICHEFTVSYCLNIFLMRLVVILITMILYIVNKVCQYLEGPHKLSELILSK